MERYHKIDKVGEGTYGVVYKALDLTTSLPVALKKIRLDLEDDGIPTTAIREVSLLKELRHDNVIRLLDVVHEPRKLYLVFDFVETDLKQLMDSQMSRDGLPEGTVRSYLFQLLAGIAFCHAHRVLHRDLKPQNLLIDVRTGRLQIADFGLSRALRLPDRSYTHEVVTLWYRAPEILLCSEHYATAVDLWSAGCIFVEMLTGTALFMGDSEIDQLFRIFRCRGSPSAEATPALCALPGYQPQFPRWRPVPLASVAPRAAADAQALALMELLLACDPPARPSARAALRHPYFSSLGEIAARECDPSACSPTIAALRRLSPSGGASPRARHGAGAADFSTPAAARAPPAAADSPSGAGGAPCGSGCAGGWGQGADATAARPMQRAASPLGSHPPLTGPRP